MEIKITEDLKQTPADSKKVVGTQISQELYLQLKQEAEESFMSISDLLRKIIFKFYKSEGKENQE